MVLIKQYNISSFIYFVRHVIDSLESENLLAPTRAFPRHCVYPARRSSLRATMAI